MPNKSLTVQLKIRVKDHLGRWSFLPPVNSKGKKQPITPHYALVNGQPKYCAEGVYYLRFIEDRKPMLVKVGPDLNQAITQQTLVQRRLAAKSVGLEVVTNTTTQHPLRETAIEYLDFVQKRGVYKTTKAYSVAVNAFVEHCKKPTLEKIEESDILAFGQYLKNEYKLTNRTIVNRQLSIRIFMRHYKVPWPVNNKNLPRWTKKVVTAYADSDVLKLAQSGTLDESEWVAFMVGTGVRETEAAHACYTDFDFKLKSYSVEEKPDFPDFHIKDSEERIIPVNDELLAMIKKRQSRYPRARLIFPTEKGEPNGHLLRIVKRMALKAGMNCGHCVSVNEKTGVVRQCDTAPVCKKWTLHDFRRTYATLLFWKGTPIQDIQKYLGHEKVETTMSYLANAGLNDPRTRKAVNEALPGLLDIVNAKLTRVPTDQLAQ